MSVDKGKFADIARITAPVYGFYAENDNRINATLPATEEATTAAGVTYEIEIYPGVGHAFLRSVAESANPTEIHKASFDAAWERFLDLLAPAQAVPTEFPRWDVNEDGVVNLFDLVSVAAHFGE